MFVFRESLANSPFHYLISLNLEGFIREERSLKEGFVRGFAVFIAPRCTITIFMGEGVMDGVGGNSDRCLKLGRH